MLHSGDSTEEFHERVPGYTAAVLAARLRELESALTDLVFYIDRKGQWIDGRNFTVAFSDVSPELHAAYVVLGLREPTE